MDDNTHASRHDRDAQSNGEGQSSRVIGCPTCGARLVIQNPSARSVVDAFWKHGPYCRRR
jgi:hypothetical protein